MGRERMIRATDHHQVVPACSAAFKGWIVCDDLDQAEVEFAPGDLPFDVSRIANHHPWNYPRIEALEALEQMRQPIGGNRGAGTHVERAGELVGQLRHA